MNIEHFKIPKTHEQKMYALIYEIKNKLPFYPAANIAGYDDQEAWEIRDEQMKENPDGVAQGLAGITTEKAWRIRESLINTCPHSVARSLVGLGDERAWKIREKLLLLIDKEGVANGLAESIAFLDDERSWELRNKLENICPLNVLEGLNGLNSEKAWNLREKYKKEHPREVAASLIGLNNEKAKEWRKKFIDKGHIDGVILSYFSSDNLEAWELREKYLNIYPFAVGTSMAGLENEKSWEFRNKLKEKAENENNQEIYKGLAQSLSPYMSAALKLNIL